MMIILNGVPNNEQHQINQFTFMPVKFKIIEPDEQIGGIIVIHFILNEFPDAPTFPAAQICLLSQVHLHKFDQVELYSIWIYLI